MDTWAATVRLNITGPASQTDPQPPLPEGMTLEQHDPQHDRAKVNVTVQAPDLASAVNAAVEAVTDAVSAWPGTATVIGAEVLRADEAARLAAHPEPLELVDDTGAAKLLGVTRQRVVALAATPSLNFPRPVAPLTRGHVYTVSSIKAFDSRWTRTTGRPPKNR
ncbi:hypothetical protein [Actinomadura violacea]|uniref:Uncharacterized protein n=1 Tax=Actinomadura violacea TaxID=2819934 RepID=A0ABS3S4U9_9ACTN|nr:hypothetical protein [Actinomadura violacea]MBO2464015.1 hypothetical protein [Actinomadura violacea]